MLPFAISNWVLFFPIIGTLAIVMCASGDRVDRGKNDSFRVALRILLWQLAIFAAAGLLLRNSNFHLLWLLVPVGFAIYALLWECNSTREILMLILFATRGKKSKVDALIHYLRDESQGILHRIGRQWRFALDNNGDWLVAALTSRLARDARSQMTLNLIQATGNTDLMSDQLRLAVEDRRTLGHWRGRILALLITTLIAISIAIFHSRMTLRIAEEFIAGDSMPDSRFSQLFIQLARHWQIPFVLGLLCAMTILIFLGFSFFPGLLRHKPMIWFTGDYYRALTLQGLAQAFSFDSRAAAACQLAAYAHPVPDWSRRLEKAQHRIEAGENFLSSLRQARILRSSESKLLSCATEAKSLANQLKWVAEEAFERSTLRSSILLQVLLVTMILIVGAFSGLIALGWFDILREWIQEMSDPNY